MVGRDDVPGCEPGRGLLEHFLIGLHVLVPVPAGLEITGAELPPLLRVVEASLEAAALLLPGDVEVDLHDGRAAMVEGLLEGVDEVVAGLPHLLRHQAEHPRREDILVVRAVEDADLAGPGRRPVDPPEEVVLRLLPHRRLEGRQGEVTNPRRVHPRRGS